MPHLNIDMEILWRDVEQYSREQDAMVDQNRIDYANKVGFDALMRLRIDRAHTVFMAHQARGGISYSGDMRHRVK